MEIKKLPAESALHGKGFEYHCKAKSGTAVIVFHVSDGQTLKKYKLRIGCTE